MNSRGKTRVLAAVWGSVALQVGRQFQTLFRLEGMDGPHSRYVPEADIYLLLDRMIIHPTKPPDPDDWGLVGIVRDRLRDQLRHQAKQRKKDFERRALFKRETDLVARQDPAFAEVDASDERLAFLNRVLPAFQSRQELFKSALAVVARLYIEESWDDADLVLNFTDYGDIRLRVNRLWKRTDQDLEQAGYGSVRRARKYLETKWMEYGGRQK